MRRFLIVSASGRAIAQSALKAGYCVDVFDQFADWDLEKSLKEIEAQQGRVFRLPRKWDLFNSVDLKQYSAAIIAGGLESKIGWIKSLAAAVPLLGCQPSQLERLQSPESINVLTRLAKRSGAYWPKTLVQPPISPGEGEWVVKSLRGSGGRHVQRWRHDSYVSEVCQWPIYQRRIEGASVSALFAVQAPSLASPELRNLKSTRRRSCQLIGCCQQLVGLPDFCTYPFSYCGSIGSFQLETPQQEIVEDLGAEIAKEFEIRGVFGIDLILNEQGVWLIDVNPRITASAEIYERVNATTGREAFSFFGTHVDACEGRPIAGQDFFSKTDQFFGKGILFCKNKDGLFIDGNRFNRLIQIYESVSDQPTKPLADIPHKGTQIPHGAPILTFFSTGSSHGTVQTALCQFAHELYEVLNR